MRIHVMSIPLIIAATLATIGLLEALKVANWLQKRGI